VQGRDEVCPFPDDATWTSAPCHLDPVCAAAPSVRVQREPLRPTARATRRMRGPPDRLPERTFPVQARPMSAGVPAALEPMAASHVARACMRAFPSSERAARVRMRGRHACIDVLDRAVRFSHGVGEQAIIVALHVLYVSIYPFVLRKASRLDRSCGVYFAILRPRHVTENPSARETSPSGPLPHRQTTIK
jgi:hypothetical protein